MKQAVAVAWIILSIKYLIKIFAHFRENKSLQNAHRIELKKGYKVVESFTHCAHYYISRVALLSITPLLGLVSFHLSLNCTRTRRCRAAGLQWWMEGGKISPLHSVDGPRGYEEKKKKGRNEGRGC